MAANTTYDKIRTLYTNLKRDTFDIVKSPSEVFEYLMRNIGSINSSITEALANVKFGGDAGHYVTHEFMPSSAENRRSQIETSPQQPLSLPQSATKDKKGGVSYGNYGRCYNNLYAVVYGSREKIKEIYRFLSEQFSKAARFYKGEESVNAKRLLYDPFRKSGRNPAGNNKNQKVGGLELLLGAA